MEDRQDRPLEDRRALWRFPDYIDRRHGPPEVAEVGEGYTATVTAIPPRPGIGDEPRLEVRLGTREVVLAYEFGLAKRLAVGAMALESLFTPRERALLAEVVVVAVHAALPGSVLHDELQRLRQKITTLCEAWGDKG